ncbi:UNVERIFIED_CONTAM: hypothetical protein FKN15_016711 [Acipenser sinensis]
MNAGRSYIDFGTAAWRCMLCPLVGLLRLPLLLYTPKSVCGKRSAEFMNKHQGMLLQDYQDQNHKNRCRRGGQQTRECKMWCSVTSGSLDYSQEWYTKIFAEVYQEARIVEEEAIGGPTETASCTVSRGVPLSRPTLDLDTWKSEVHAELLSEIQGQLAEMARSIMKEIRVQPQSTNDHVTKLPGPRRVILDLTSGYPSVQMG